MKLFLGFSGTFSGTIDLFDLLDDTDSDGLTHVTDGEATEGSVVGEGFDTQGLGGGEFNDGGVTGLDELGGLFHGLVGTTIDLGEEFGELASDVSGVTINDWGVTSGDLTGMVENDDLSVE